MEESNFIATDLHIHTPASKCYEGEKNDEEYIKILRNYYDNNIPIVAITDHNTIKGYKEILRIKKEIEQKIKILGNYASKIPDLETELVKLKSDSALFNNLTILPGIEFEANPGIHILLIFSPDQDLNEIDKFLENTGYTQSIQGFETPDIEIEIDVLETLKAAKELNALTIAAHVDSNKGIYNDLKGSYRARVFKSDSLDGISVNNIVQIEKIKNLLKQPDYKRNKPLAIIQSSDHHHQTHCGRKVTYINAPKRTFSSIVECFKNPIENISPTEKPEVKNIINSLANDKNTLLLDTIDFELIKQAACSILNNSYGAILIGVSKDKYKNIKGVNIEDDTINTLTEIIQKSIVPEKIFYSLSIKAIPYGKSFVVMINLHSISEKHFFYNDKFYRIDNYDVLECLPSQLLDLSRQKNQKTVESFYSNYDKRLEKINTELQLLMESKNSLRIIDKINADGILLSEIFDIELLHNNPDKNFENIPPFGGVIENVFYTKSYLSRPNDCYLRCTCPSTDKFEFSEEISFKGPSLILVPGGGTHIVENESFNIYNVNTKYPSLIMTLKDEFSSLNLHVILAWMKCSITLWYSYSLYKSIDLYSPTIFRGLFIPTKLFHNQIASLLEQKIKEIISIETQFLSKSSEMTNGELSKEEEEEVLMNFAENHNNKVDNYAIEIDQIINENLSITEEEEDMLMNFLILKEIHAFESE